jgi:hypothetical protein
MAEYRIVADTEHGGHPSSASSELGTAGGKDAALDAMQPTGVQAMVDRLRRQSEG